MYTLFFLLFDFDVVVILWIFGFILATAEELSQTFVEVTIKHHDETIRLFHRHTKHSRASSHREGIRTHDDHVGKALVVFVTEVD